MLTYVKDEKFYHHSTELISKKEKNRMEVKTGHFP